MAKKDSPWKATATADPSAIGAGVTRAMALQLAGQLGRRSKSSSPACWSLRPFCWRGSSRTWTT